MRVAALFLATAALLVVPSTGSLANELQDGVKITAGGEPIDIQVGHLVPCVVDWNQDNKKDLVIGQFSGGKIRLYLNRGTDKKPKLKDFRYLEAGGKEISLPAG